jgi:DNA repair protein RadA/Sms
MKVNVKVKGIKRGTNINDIVVPDQLRRRIKTGFEMWDAAIAAGDDAQGMVPSTVFMLTGGPGTGKSTMLRQMADSIVAQGHMAIYNSGEESLYQVKMTVERMGLKHGFLVGQDTQALEVIAYAEAVMKANPGKLVFMLIDSLQTMDDGFYADGTTNSKTPGRVTEILVDWAKKTYNIVVFIGQCNKDGDFHGENKIKHAVDGHVHCYFDKSKKSETYGERIMEVQKNRFGMSGKSIIYGIGKAGAYEKGEVTYGAEA